MFDVDRIKSSIDCRDLVARDLGQPTYRGSNYNKYRCPLHDEEYGYSLAVYADHWRCFGKCNRGGDVISWMEEYHTMTFQEACGYLEETVGLGLSRLEHQIQHQPKRGKIQSEPPDENWQSSAREISKQAQHMLWSQSGSRALKYLTGVRRLSEDTIHDVGLGYIPGDYREWRQIAGLNVPCGITIPWQASDAIWGIKVRRSAGDQRYQQVGGGNIKGCLYLVDDIRAGQPLMLTEGEFDALIVRQAGKGIVSGASIGSSANHRINIRWYKNFLLVPRILVRMDADEAGEGASEQIMRLSRATRHVQVPHGKDVNEFYQIAGEEAVRAWLESLVV